MVDVEGIVQFVPLTGLEGGVSIVVTSEQVNRLTPPLVPHIGSLQFTHPAVLLLTTSIE
jgi:hypothetical protein